MPQTLHTDQQHRAILQSIAQRAMLERGLLPDFSAAVACRTYATLCLPPLCQPGGGWDAGDIVAKAAMVTTCVVGAVATSPATHLACGMRRATSEAANKVRKSGDVR
jgi:hypothetical protein